ncbi:MAG: spike base protein, RCAP_Rcc01079 family [Brevirhabdus sp.]
MQNPFANHASTLTSVPEDVIDIVPSDTTDLPVVCRGLIISGSGGDVRVRMYSGAEVTLKNLQVGIDYPRRITRVLATGTTATQIQGLV